MLKEIFSGIHGMPLTSMHRKKDALPYNGDSHAIPVTGTKLLDIKSKFYRSNGDLIETNS